MQSLVSVVCNHCLLSSISTSRHYVPSYLSSSRYALVSLRPLQSHPSCSIHLFKQYAIRHLQLPLQHVFVAGNNYNPQYDTVSLLHSLIQYALKWLQMHFYVLGHNVRPLHPKLHCSHDHVFQTSCHLHQYPTLHHFLHVLLHHRETTSLGQSLPISKLDSRNTIITINVIAISFSVHHFVHPETFHQYHLHPC